jgi:PKHD-type hydroxylase
MMLHIPDVLTREQVIAIRAAIDAADWVDGRATAGSQGAQVKRNRQLPENSPVALEQGRIIEQALAAHPLYFSAALPARTMAPLFNRYADSETYGLHVDGAARRLAGPHPWMRTDVSSTLFLTDPEDYDGGELVVVDTYGTHEVKLPAGDLILSPSTSLHRVEPVTRGERVCSSSGRRAWCATTRGAPCCSRWTRPSSACVKDWARPTRHWRSPASITTCCACGPRPEGQLQGLCFSAQPTRWL